MHWRDVHAERACGELLGLHGRLCDTSREEWELRFAWLSPPDVHELRDGLATFRESCIATSEAAIP